MIVVTGAAGFIGSCFLTKLNLAGIDEVVIVDDFSKQDKEKNYHSKKYYQKIERNAFIDWFKIHAAQIKYVVHIGARTDTTEFNKQIFDELNISYSQAIWNICTNKQIPLIYISSAATYGLGEYGYDDDEKIIPKLIPLNPYGDSKNDFDKWVLAQTLTPPMWHGFKFFNVYGPNENHKARMASVIFHAYHQILKNKSMKLFKSHNPNYKDGEQLRDFVYVQDVIDVLFFTINQTINNGIYNLGSGKARTFLDLTKATFKALSVSENIDFIDTPLDIRDKYQYFTEANMTKLIQQGYTKPFTTLEEGVTQYVHNYLMQNKYF